MSKEIVSEILSVESQADKIVKEGYAEQKEILAEARAEGYRLIAKTKEDAQKAAQTLLAGCEEKMAADVQKIKAEYQAQAEKIEAAAAKNMQQAVEFICKQII